MEIGQCPLGHCGLKCVSLWVDKNRTPSGARFLILEDCGVSLFVVKFYQGGKFMKCVVCGEETGNDALCCDRCAEKMAGRAEPEREDDCQAELGEAQNSEIVLSKTKRKKWLLIAVPLLLVAIMIFGAIKSVRPVFKLSANDFVDKWYDSGLGNEIADIAKKNKYTCITTKSGITILMEEDKLRPNILSVMITVDKTIVDMTPERSGAVLGAVLIPTMEIVDNKFNADDDGYRLLEKISAVALHIKSKNAATYNNTYYYISRIDDDLAILITPSG